MEDNGTANHYPSVVVGMVNDVAMGEDLLQMSGAPGIIKGPLSEGSEEDKRSGQKIPACKIS